jgi:hypothetical protein
VVNGGYIGTMEAVSRGAASRGDDWGYLWRDRKFPPVSPNPWLTKKCAILTFAKDHDDDWHCWCSNCYPVE